MWLAAFRPLWSPCNRAGSGRNLGDYGFRLDKYRHESGEHILKDRRRNRFDKPRLPRVEIKDARLIAPHDPRGFCPREFNSKPNLPGKLPTARDRQDHRQLCRVIKSGTGYNQDWAATALFMSSGRIERDEINVALFHRISRPTAGASSHARSSSDIGGE